MTVSERVEILMEIFEDLQGTTSRLVKLDIIDSIPAILKDDFNFCLEVLAGKHKLGYKYEYVDGTSMVPVFCTTIKELVEYLKRPSLEHNLSRENIYKHLARTCEFAEFLEPLCNCTYKLGIGNSVLEKSSTAPMLAKKFEGQLGYGDFYVTEKLDGNRCIAYYEDNRWHFVSRSGKHMNVDFDMSGLPEELVYDGEVVSPAQVEMSDAIVYSIRTGNDVGKIHTDFNATSGLINRHTANKSLIYCIFDIQDTATYIKRRELLEHLNPMGKDVRILKLLAKVNRGDEEYLGELLDKVVSIGGEGLMINWAHVKYENKRTNALLKYKQVQTMDMLVIDTFEGNGKYQGMCGGITCFAELADGQIQVDVGSGLNDAQRFAWRDKNKIVGKIVEVSYFSLSQNKETLGSNFYSLRFPRLKKVRTDKNDTSEY